MYSTVIYQRIFLPEGHTTNITLILVNNNIWGEVLHSVMAPHMSCQVVAQQECSATQFTGIWSQTSV